MIPIDTHNVRCRLRAWGLLFVCALFLNHARTEISVDGCLYRSWEEINIDMINSVHGCATVVRRR